MTLPVKARPEVSEDLRQLGSNALRFEALSYLVRLEAEPYLGQRLGRRAATGNLADCRKIYFGKGSRFRIVYRLLPNEGAPTEVDVIVIGEREAYAAYAEALKRLGRT